MLLAYSSVKCELSINLSLLFIWISEVFFDCDESLAPILAKDSMPKLEFTTGEYLTSQWLNAFFALCCSDYGVISCTKTHNADTVDSVLTLLHAVLMFITY